MFAVVVEYVPRGGLRGLFDRVARASWCIARASSESIQRSSRRTCEAARATTLYTSCEPCAMCANVIARARIGRVVFALSGEQLAQLKPPGAVAPDAWTPDREGPALFDEARRPIDGYYD